MSLYTLNFTIQMGQLQKLTKLLQNFDKIKAEIVDGIGQIAVTEFTLNFRKQGFNGEAWKPKKKPNGKNILIGRGTLRRSITVTKKTIDTVTIGSNVPYAYIHNYGGVINKKASTRVLNFRNRDMDWDRKNKKYKTGTRFSKSKKAHYSQKVSIGSYSINMPQRKFMGDMPSLTKKITAFIKRKFENIDK